jgi:hypothetical protein
MSSKGQIRDAVQGAWLEFGTFTLDPASIAAASQGTTTVTIDGATSGDLIFISPEGLDNKLAPAGAKVTAADTVTVYLNNVIDSTTAVDGASKTWSYILVHLS